jgi:hypothetical protein
MSAGYSLRHFCFCFPINNKLSEFLNIKVSIWIKPVIIIITKLWKAGNKHGHRIHLQELQWYWFG